MSRDRNFKRERPEKIETRIEEKEETLVEEKQQPNEQNDSVLEHTNATIKGVVSGCYHLRMREKPEITAPTIHVLNEGTKVAINRNEIDKDSDFYKVYLEHNGTPESGYCMKKFIEIVNKEDN